MQLRERILSEIRRLAEADGGRPPGVRKFELETGIKNAEWNGVIWARWGDAVAAAGYLPNAKQERFDSKDVLSGVVEAVRHYGKVPTVAEMKLYRRVNATLPNPKTISRHYPTPALLIAALRQRASEDIVCADIAGMLPKAAVSQAEEPQSGQDGELADGYVYLLKWGDRYKVGCAANLERRVKEIRTEIPDELEVVHSIRTDDQFGIEGYWKRRFKLAHLKGEWFKLNASDVRAFKKRKFQ